MRGLLPTQPGPVGVWGLVNWETTVAVPGFPLALRPNLYVRERIGGGPSGVAYNVAAAVAHLGERPVRLTALVGRDHPGQLVRARLSAPAGGAIGSIGGTVAAGPARGDGLDIRLVDVERGAQSLVLYEDGGDRMVLNDPGDAVGAAFPDRLVEDVADCGWAILPAIGANRPVLAAALAAGVPVGCDVHALTDAGDRHHAAFLAGASVLFCSDAELAGPPREWLRALGERFGTPLIVMGRGARGALLTRDQGRSVVEVPTVVTRRVRCTVGAGDALCAATVDGLAAGLDPVDAVRRAVVFASHACGEPGGAAGFASAAELAALMTRPDQIPAFPSTPDH